MPPIDKVTEERYDSVYGQLGDTGIYIVYDNGKSYPEYLVKYSTKSTSLKNLKPRSWPQKPISVPMSRTIPSKLPTSKWNPMTLPPCGPFPAMSLPPPSFSLNSHYARPFYADSSFLDLPIPKLNTPLLNAKLDEMFGLSSPLGLLSRKVAQRKANEYLFGAEDRMSKLIDRLKQHK